MPFRQIHIDSQNASGRGAKITTADGQPIHGVRRGEITLDHTEVTIAKLELFATASFVAEGMFTMVDPLSGERKTISKIYFEDGSCFQGRV